MILIMNFVIIEKNRKKEKKFKKVCNKNWKNAPKIRRIFAYSDH